MGVAVSDVACERELSCCRCGYPLDCDTARHVGDLHGTRVDDVACGEDSENDCEADMVWESHDDATCDCSYCRRARAKADRLRRAAEARAHGGVTMAGLRLVGLDGGDDV
jgi:hypothetical protein